MLIIIASDVAAWLQYGRIEEMNVCDNLGDHLVGNVYIKVSEKYLSGNYYTTANATIDVCLWPRPVFQNYRYSRLGQVPKCAQLGIVGAVKYL